MRKPGPGVADDLERELARLLKTARDLLGARYAALAVLDRRHIQIEHFITVGLDERAREAIGPHPRGRGVLGLLLTDPRPLRLGDVGSHPFSYGFPASHPPMRGFLGVPILLAGEPCGNLYFADKRSGPFEQVDEYAAIALAERAAAAVKRARAEMEAGR